MHHPSRISAARVAAAAAAACLTAGCAIPTDLPIVEQRWNVPAASSTIAVTDLLPSAVTVRTGEFDIGVPAPQPVVRTLFQDCAACAAANGLTIAKPEFTAVATSNLTLPADLIAAALRSGTVSLDVTNGYNFDPLNPGAGATGTITVAITQGSVTLGTATLDGLAFPLAASGGRRIFDVEVTGEVSGGAPVVATVTVRSPTGAPVRQQNGTLTVAASVLALRAPSARVRVADRLITATSELDLGDVDASVADRVDSAAVRLAITNPFAVGGTLDVTFETAGAPIRKSITLAPNAAGAVQVVALAATEIRSLLGQNVRIRIAGPVAAAGPVAVTPSQAVTIATRLDLYLALGR